MRTRWGLGCRCACLLALGGAGVATVAAPTAKPAGGVGLRPPSVDAFARFVQSLPTGDSHSLVFAVRSANRMRAETMPPMATLAGSTVALVPPGGALVVEVGAGTAFREGALLLFQHRETGRAAFTVHWVPAGSGPESRTCGRVGAASWRTVTMELDPREGSRGTIGIALADGTADMEETLAVTGLAVVAVSAEEREQWRRMRRALAEAGQMLDALNGRRHALELLLGQVRRAEALGLAVRAASVAAAWNETATRLSGLEQRYDALHQLQGPLLLQGKTDDWTAHLGLLVRDAARLDGSLTSLKTRLLASLARAGARPPVVAARTTGLPYVTVEDLPSGLATGAGFDTPAAAAGDTPGRDAPRRWAAEPWPDRPADAAACRAMRVRLWCRFAEGAEGVALRRPSSGASATNGLYDPRYGNDRISPAAVAACAARDEARRLWTYFATTSPVGRAAEETAARCDARDLFVQERRAVRGRLLVLVNENATRSVVTVVHVPGRYVRATDLGIGPGARLRLESEVGTTRFPVTLGPGEATLVALAQ